MLISEYVEQRIVRGIGCWEWTGPKINQYAYIASGRPLRRASRAIWEYLHGPIPPEGRILHRCDNRGCVNPDHLWVGTQADNMHDMAAKGRSGRGSQNSQAKLSEAQVLELRALRAQGWKLTVLAERYGIDQAAVSGIARRVSWRHI